jgi:rubredoxin
MEVNLICGSCGHNFNYEVGEPDIDENDTLVFEHIPVCPKCGVKGKERLSELGQSQMTKWHLGDDDIMVGFF